MDGDGVTASGSVAVAGGPLRQGSPWNECHHLPHLLLPQGCELGQLIICVLSCWLSRNPGPRLPTGWCRSRCPRFAAGLLWPPSSRRPLPSRPSTPARTCWRSRTGRARASRAYRLHYRPVADQHQARDEHPFRTPRYPIPLRHARRERRSQR